MKYRFLILFFIALGFISTRAQVAEMGLNFTPHKFYLTNPAEKVEGGGFTEVLPTLRSGSSVGVFFNKILGNQNGLQLDVNFMHQTQNYIYTGLSDNKSKIYTSFNTINIGISHNIYLWYYDNDDNIMFSYGLSYRRLMDYTDFYSLEFDSKTNGVITKDLHLAIIENDKSVSTNTITRNDSILSVTGDTKTAAPRYTSSNIGFNFGIHFLHYFTDNLAFTVGAKTTYYLMNPENTSSGFWSTTSKFKYGTVSSSDDRIATKMYSFGLSLSLIYCFGR